VAFILLAVAAMAMWVARSTRDRSTLARVDTIRAREFLLEDEKGRIVGELGRDRVGVPGLFFGDQAHGPGIAIGGRAPSYEINIRGRDSTRLSLMSSELMIVKESFRGRSFDALLTTPSSITGIGTLSNHSWLLLTGPDSQRVFYPTRSRGFVDSLLRATLESEEPHEK
jgi:hypothetical protein